jgi:hypothetical protein
MADGEDKAASCGFNMGMTVLGNRSHMLYTVKKRLTIFPPPAGMSLTKPSLFPPRESLVSDILAGDG